jgi:hypothetical protein
MLHRLVDQGVITKAFEENEMKEELEDNLQDHQILQFFIILMFIEHLIILFKFFLEEWIPDSPAFVELRAIKVQQQIESMSLVNKENEKKEQIAIMK